MFLLGWAPGLPHFLALRAQRSSGGPRQGGRLKVRVWRVRKTAELPSLLWGQEMPQNLSPERTPPSEEDLAEAERLKTEGKKVLHAHQAACPPGLRRLWGG